MCTWVHSRDPREYLGDLGAGVRAWDLVRTKDQLVWDISHSPDRMHKAGGCRLQAKDVLAYVGGGQGREDSLVGERPVQDCQLDGAGKTCTVFDIRSVLKSVTLPSLRYYSSAL